MSWASSLNLSELTPEALAKKLSRRLRSPMQQGELITLYNHMMAACKLDPEGVARKAEVLVALFQRRRDPEHQVLFLELCARAWMLAGKLEPSLSAAQQANRLAHTRAQRRDLVELAEALVADAGSELFADDLFPRALAVATGIFGTAGLLEKQIDAYLAAAGLFARHGAIQAAYRAASDAERVARDSDSLALLVKVHREAAVIAFRERDFEWSVAAGEQALRGYAQLGWEPPAALRANTATSMMNSGREAEAAAALKELIAEFDDDGGLRGPVALNLAACLRRLGDLDGAEGAIAVAHACLGSQGTAEMRLELALVTGRIAQDQRSFPRLAAAIRAAAASLDELVASVNRLHYRRGVREGCMPRLEALLHGLPKSGPVDDVADGLATIYGGILADWIAVLDWADRIAANERLPIATREEALESVRAVAADGAPFLFGFDEKYDDPWEPQLRPFGWTRFGQAVSDVVRAGEAGPFAAATTAIRAALIRERIAQGYAITAQTRVGTDAYFWILAADKYQRIEIDQESLAKFRETLMRFEGGEAGRLEMAAALRGLYAPLSAELNPIFDALAATPLRGIIHLQGASDVVPMTVLAAEHSALYARMCEGTLEIRMAPALYPTSEAGELRNPRLVAIVDEADDLLLARHEGQAAGKVAQAAEVVRLAPDDNDGLHAAVRDGEMLVVSTHGSPLSRYTDPIFGSLGTGGRTHCISVSRLQSSFPWLPYKLAILNACHASSGLARNYQARFKTNDLASYPGLLLLNRRSVVGSSAWRTSDTAGYLHLVLTAAGIADGLSPALALTRATARLRSLTKAEASELISLIPDEHVAAEALARITSAPETGMFGEPYVYGGFGVYSLV